MQHKGWNSDLFPILLIVVIPLLMIGGALLPGHTMYPADLLSVYPPWQGIVEGQPISNGLLIDDIQQFYPWHKLAYAEAQVTGRFPLWNPYELTGQPLVANAQSALYYPPNLLLHWIRPEVVVVICAYFNLLLLGIATYYFCREIDLRRVSSIFASIIGMLSGAAIVFLGNPLVNSMASLPLMLLAAEKILNGKRLIPWISMLAVAVGLSILGGHPETSFHICLALGLYFLIRLIQRRPGIRKAAEWTAAVLAGVFVGLLIGAIQWLPFLDLLFHSATLAEGGRSMGGANVFFSPEWKYNLTTLVTFLIPNFFGSPITNNYYWPFPNYQNYSEQAVYFGLIPLALAFSALFNRKLRPQVLALTAISLFFLAVAWRLPGFEAINHIPPFSLLLNKRLKLFIPMMLAIVAAIGLNNWLDREQDEGLMAQDRIPALVPPVITAAIIAILAAINIFPPLRDLLASRYPAFTEHLIYQVFNLNQPRILVSLVVPLIFILLVFLSWRRVISLRLLAAFALAITVVELAVIGWNYNTVAQQSQVYPQIPLVTLLQNESQPFRTLTTDLSTFPPNAGAAYEIAQVEGYDLPVYSSIYEIYRAQGGEKPSHRQVWSVDFPLLDWLNVRYVISPKPIEKEGYQLVLDQPTYKVYRNDNAYPRANMVYEYRVIDDKAALLKEMVTNPESLATQVLFDTVPGDVSLSSASAPGENPSQVEYTDYAMDRSSLSVNTPRAGFLVVSDLYADGWKAKVDGKLVPILLANYAYRAVYLPAGQHQVEFYYQPVAFLVGKSLSALGVIILIFVGIFEIYRIKTKKR